MLVKRISNKLKAIINVYLMQFSGNHAYHEIEFDMHSSCLDLKKQNLKAKAEKEFKQ